jgi:hypothetical protein
LLSNTVKVGSLNQSSKHIRIFSNPVITSTISLELSNLLQGTYHVRLVNDLGQIVLMKKIDYSGGIGVQSIQLNGTSIKNGIYRIQLLGGKNELIETESVIIQL